MICFLLIHRFDRSACGAVSERARCVPFRLLVALLLFTLLGANHAAADPEPGASSPMYLQTRWTIDDGLPVNAVNDLAWAPDGYLWIATYDGVVRFDGTDFRVYRSGDTPGLPSSRFTSIHLHDSTLWLITEAGEVVRMQNGQFETRTDLRAVLQLYEGPTGTLWALTRQSLYRWQADPVPRFAPVASQAVPGAVQSLLERADGTLWIGTDDGLFYIHPDGTSRHWTIADGLAHPMVDRIVPDPETAAVWVSSMQPGLRFALQHWTTRGQIRGERRTFPIRVMEASVQPDSALWLASPDGIYRWTGRALVRDNRFRARGVRNIHGVHAAPIRFRTDGAVWTRAGRRLYRDTTLVFEARVISALLKGQRGTLWIGTNDGLVKLRPSNVRTWGRPEGLPDPNLYTIVQRQDGTIWMGSLERGVATLTAQGIRTFVPYRGKQRVGNIIALHEDRSGTLWAGGAALCRLEGTVCAPEERLSITRTRIRSIYEDRSERLWVGTRDGLFMRERRDDSASTWHRFTPSNSGLAHPWVRAIREMDDGTLWMATNGGGITRYRNGRFASFTEADGLPSNLVRDIHRDTTGTFWIATEDNGLVRLQWHATPDSVLRAASLAHISTEDGLFDSALHRILPDDQGRFWISSNRGIFWVRRRDLNAVAAGTQARVSSVAYTTRHGLRNREANGGSQSSGIRARDGRLWFPTQAGAVVIDPAADPLTEPPPPVVIETLTPSGGTPRDGLSAPVTLPPVQRDFSIRYAGIEFHNPAQLRFRYRLAGYNDTWMDAGTRREAFFTQVPAGRYTFEVSARTSRSDWSAPVTQTLDLEPYFYETTGFAVLGTALFVLALASLVYGGVQYRLRRLRRRERDLRKRVAEQTKDLRREKAATQKALATVEEQAAQLAKRNATKARFFTNISHELRTPLTLIQTPAQQLRAQAASETTQHLAATIYRNSKRLEVLTRQLLDLARYDEGQLPLALQRHPLRPFVEALHQRFMPRADARAIALLCTPPAPDMQAAFDAEHMETVVVNLLDNALRHTPRNGTVRLAATVEAGAARLAVHDTGPGIPEDEQEALFERFHQRSTPAMRNGSTGIGLALVRALMDLHDGTATVNSTPGEGTTFTVRWPARAHDTSIPQATEAGQAVLSGSEAGVQKIAPPESRSNIATDAASQSRSDASLPVRADAPGDRPTVLVVEDNAETRDVLRIMLTPRYHVRTATDGMQGHEAAQTHLPDCIVADVMMPRMDGLEMVAALREIPATACIPVILLTARGDTKHRVSGVAAGAAAFIAKPFHPEVLHAHIAQCLEAQRRLRNRLQAEARQRMQETSAADSRTADTKSESSMSDFEREARAIVRDHFTDSTFDVGDLAQAMAISRSTLYRRARANNAPSPAALVRDVRMNTAHRLLETGEGTVTEVGYAVGYESLSSFSDQFHTHFGYPPSQVRPEDT